MQSKIAAGAAALLLFAAGAAHAEMLKFKAQLRGPDEVPTNDTTGAGKVTASLDTTSKAFDYVVTYSGLTGPAVGAHFHGPALAGENAPPVIMVMTLTSPMTGRATLTDAQIADLEAGKWYFNVHTKAHPGGEIRGQLQAAH